MTQSTKQFKLEKSIWSEVDFDNMNWHDNPIHGLIFSENYELILDIDYVFEWILKGKKYNFLISPCTLVFENVYDLIFDIGPTTPGLTIDSVTRENPKQPKNFEVIKRDTEFDWHIEVLEGIISFKSVGFKQYVRQIPRLLRTQNLTLGERGGISFETNSI